MPKTKKQSKPEEGESIGVHELLGVADDYLTNACLLTAYAKDATSKRGMERMAKALSFASKVIALLGGNVE